MECKQLNFDLDYDLGVQRSPSVSAAIKGLSKSTNIEARGAIFTRVEVVNFILDLAGYTLDKPLHKMRLLEPSFGRGDFLLPLVKRLLAAWQARKKSTSAFDDLKNAVCAVELHYETYCSTRIALIDLLKSHGLTAKVATALADSWLIQDDFLLTKLPNDQFDFVVGNPPYVRQELIPAALVAVYRARYTTMYDRADIYIPFIERSLSVLTKGGVLGFICADRWMKNRYGGPLRSLVAKEYWLKIYVDMVNTSAFQSDVVAYPAITIISRETQGATRIAHQPQIDEKMLVELAKTLHTKKVLKPSSVVRELASVTDNDAPWLLESSDQMALIRRIEQQFPCLEEVGCKVGIGVATGADKVFIGDYDSLDVELDCKLPLATTKDIKTGEVKWLGTGVINPFNDDGSLVDLKKYPRLKAYLELHKAVVSQRHCAQKNLDNWYRTIDRITPSLATTPKLLIPDIKGEAHVVFESGELYPHHNLYYVTSDQWDLRALQAVMLSAMARLFVATYSTKMRGGFLRFQAQYLRRVRLPLWTGVPAGLRRELIKAATKRDIDACNRAVCKLYGLSEQERFTLGVNEG